MRPLHDARRRRALFCSALLCAVPLCLAPLAGRSSLELADEQATFDARFSAPALAASWRVKPVNVERDPFRPDGGSRSAAPPHDNGVVGMHVTQGRPIGFPLTPNTAQLSSVTAIITGSSARALIDDGSRVRVVGIGDALDGARVSKIDATGVHLTNGKVLPLTEDEP